MKRTWTVIGARDVPGSFKWYQSLFGQPETGPAHDYFGQILDGDGTVLLCLHQWDVYVLTPESGRILRDNQCPLNFRIDTKRRLPKIAGMKKTQFLSYFILTSLFFANQITGAAEPAADQPIVPPADALTRLKEGNSRFTAGNPQHPHESADERKYMAANSLENAGAIALGMTSEQAAKRRAELIKSQHPFAIILSCSDSRVPPETVFDEGLGDLFIVRVAGNVLNTEGLGSIEYGVEILGARLIVVLGHQSCGAVDAAMKTVASKGKAPGHIQSLVTAIKPVVNSTPKADLETMTKANVKHVVDALRSSTPILKARVDSGDVQVIGGYYTLDTGAVTFLEGK